MASGVPAIELHAADLEPAAVACARDNLSAIGGQVWAGDLYAALPVGLRGRIDLLLANVPYVRTEHIALLPAEARLHEPMLALDGGSDGLDVFRAVVASAPQWLAPGGVVMSETTEAQTPAAMAVLTAAGLHAEAVYDDDLEATRGARPTGRRGRPGERWRGRPGCDKVCLRQRGPVNVSLVRRFARARLAGQVIRRLRRAGVAEAGYDAATFSVRFRPVGHDGAAIMSLEILLGELTGPRRERRARVDAFVDGFIRLPDVPGTWEQACPRLRPVLRGAAPMSGEGLPAPLRRPALPYLTEFVVVDQPDTMTFVAPDLLEGWGVGEDEVFAAARANLSVAVRQPPATAPVVLRFVDDGDAYWTSHLLIDGWLTGLCRAGRRGAGGVRTGTCPAARDRRGR